MLTSSRTPPDIRSNRSRAYCLDMPPDTVISWALPLRCFKGWFMVQRLKLPVLNDKQSPCVAVLGSRVSETKLSSLSPYTDTPFHEGVHSVKKHVRSTKRWNGGLTNYIIVYTIFQWYHAIIVAPSLIIYCKDTLINLIPACV
jgi:hypothetical protein